MLTTCSASTNDEIKKAYKRLAFELHPDRNAADRNAAQKFRRATRAYGLLSNPLSRAALDAKLASAKPRKTVRATRGKQKPAWPEQSSVWARVAAAQEKLAAVKAAEEAAKEQKAAEREAEVAELLSALTDKLQGRVSGPAANGASFANLALKTTEGAPPMERVQWAVAGALLDGVLASRSRGNGKRS